jgi:hypothetical protein
MKKTVISIFLLAALVACENKPKETPTDKNGDSSDVVLNDSTALGVVKEIELIPLKDSPEFADAILDLNSPDDGAVLKSNAVKFSYDIKNYQLAKPTTEGSCAINCANSDKGQHIHLILNNQPYLAKYQPSFTDSLADGHYIALSFLSRSYHESLKHFGASDVRQFTVGKGPKEKVDLSKPMLFYSRPKGEYKGKDTENVLLDFFLTNTTLSETGNRVRATINGKSFIITDWRGYVIKGLPLGESTIKLELLDAAEKEIPGKYNVVERKITLTK